MIGFKIEPGSGCKLIGLLIVLLLWNPTGALADIMLKFRWDPNPEPYVAGYRVFSRLEGTDYDYHNPDWDGQVPECIISVKDAEAPYFFVVRAYDEDGFESADSNELRYPRFENDLYRSLESSETGGGSEGGCFITNVFQ